MDEEAHPKENPKLLRITSLYGTKLDVEKDYPFVWCIGSIDESKVTKLKGLVNKYFFRIYPKGTRVDSSNYDPLPAWNVGA
jgi:hypothetical protein